MNEFDPLFEDIYDYCDVQKLDVDTLSHEAGRRTDGDQLQSRRSDGSLADQTFLFKRTVRQAALDHDVHATFMAKPMQSQPGSAMHIHISVVDMETGRISLDEDGEPTDGLTTRLAGCRNICPRRCP